MQFHFHIQPSELESIPFYEYEYMAEDLVEILEEKKKAESGQSSEYTMNQNTDSLMKNAGKYMPKMSGFKFPSLSGVGLK